MHCDNISTVAVSGRLDAANVEAFKDEATQAARNAQAVIVDFSKASFVDSMGLGALVNLLKACSSEDVSLALAGLTPQVRQIFELTRLYRLFDIYDSPSKAYAALEEQAS